MGANSEYNSNLKVETGGSLVTNQNSAGFKVVLLLGLFSYFPVSLPQLPWDFFSSPFLWDGGGMAEEEGGLPFALYFLSVQWEGGAGGNLC